MDYDPTSGNLLSRTESGCESNGGTVTTFALTTLYDYSQTTAASPSAVDPPGYVSTGEDVTSFDYDPSRGDLVETARHHPLLGTETYAHDGFNRRTAVTDANGVQTTTTYDALGRVTSSTRKGATAQADERTEYFYTQLGDLFCVRLPEGNGILYEYETATGRLHTITRGTAIAGTPSPPSTCLNASLPRERQVMTFEPYGRVATARRERCSGSGCSWVVDAQTEHQYSSRCNRDRTIDAPGSPAEAITELEYTCDGALARVWDLLRPRGTFPSSPSLHYQYDLLDRLVTTTQPWAGAGGGVAVTAYAYDAHDRLAAVVDAVGNETLYEFSDRDLLTRQLSPVAGETRYSYNEHGELVEQIDARGIVTTRTVDGADRVLAIDHDGEPQLLTTFSYGTNPAAFDFGRLTGITRTGATVGYAYDRFGRVIQDGALGFDYDKNGRRKTVVYPGGDVASYSFDFADRESGVALDSGSGPATLASASLYTAFGPLRQLTFGSTPARTETRTFDLRLAPASISVSGGLFSWGYTLDKVGNVLAIDDGSPQDLDRFFSYQDVHYFLTAENSAFARRTWTYDKVGNRLEFTDGIEAGRYVYATGPTGGNTRLEQIWSAHGHGPDALQRRYEHDAAGNVILTENPFLKDAQFVDYSVDATGSLASLSALQGERLDFFYDGRGFLREGQVIQRPYVETSYDSSGRLFSLSFGAAPGSGAPSSHVVYLAGRPVAQIDRDSQQIPRATFLVTDHLGTPALAFDASGSATWSGGFTAFGSDWQAGTPAGALENGIYLRLPGQWDHLFWRRELSQGEGDDLYYNVHRWYETQTGRFTTPDPEWDGDYIGINHFTYAVSNPMRFIDVTGRRYWPPGIGGFVQNNSSCGLLAFGDPGPFSPSGPIGVPPRRASLFGLTVIAGTTPTFGDVDFICVGGEWRKIRGPVMITRQRQLRTILPARPATPDELKGLPPCQDPPCDCVEP